MGKDETDREIVLATCVDDAYLPFVWVVARSAAWSTRLSRPTTFHVFHTGTDAVLARRLDGFRSWRLRVVVHSIESGLAHLTRPGQFPAVSYLRLKLPALLPDAPRVVYLDGDLLVRASLGPLFDTDLEGRPVAAVPDVPQGRPPTSVNHPRFSGTFAQYSVDILGIPYDRERLTYVNAGVMVMDLELMRTERFTERVLALAEELIDRTVWHDQDALNALLAGRVTLLDPSWNVMPEVLAGPIAGSADIQRLIRRQRERQWIVHFASSLKPWRVSGLPFSREWCLWAAFSPIGEERLRVWVSRQIGNLRRIKPETIELFKRKLPRTFAATFKLWQMVRRRSR